MWHLPLLTVIRPRPRRGFTLIELLVVISIIAILAAMLMPAIAMVRNSALSARCQSNLHQIGMAFFAYANDLETYPDVKMNSVTYWSQSLEPYVESDNDYQNSLANTKAKRGVLRSCPRWPNSPFYGEISTTNNVQANEQLGYGMTKNCFLPWTSGGPAAQPQWNSNYRAASPTSITYPAQRVMVGDARQYFLDATQPAYFDPTRHGSHTNFVFFDGHTAALVQADVLKSLTNPSTL